MTEGKLTYTHRMYRYEKENEVKQMVKTEIVVVVFILRRMAKCQKSIIITSNERAASLEINHQHSCGVTLHAYIQN